MGGPEKAEKAPQVGWDDLGFTGLETANTRPEDLDFTGLKTAKKRPDWVKPSLESADSAHAAPRKLVKKSQFFDWKHSTLSGT